MREGAKDIAVLRSGEIRERFGFRPHVAELTDAYRRKIIARTLDGLVPQSAESPHGSERCSMPTVLIHCCSFISAWKMRENP
jgi:hypothetical protein